MHSCKMFAQEDGLDNMLFMIYLGVKLKHMLPQLADDLKLLAEHMRTLAFLDVLQELFSAAHALQLRFFKSAA